MVNEIILTVLFILAGVSVLVSLCAGAAKIGGIFTGVSIISISGVQMTYLSIQTTILLIAQNTKTVSRSLTFRT